MITLKSESKVDKFGQIFFQVSYRDGDNLIEKDVSLEDYKRIINGSVQEVTTWVDVPKVPSQIYDFQISSKGEADGYRVIIHVKEGMKPFSYAGDIMRIPFPGIVFYLEIIKGDIREKKVYAVKDEILCPDTELYHYPFGNVYDDGRICMGNISVNIPTIQDSLKFVDAFFEGRTNSDLSRNKNTMGYTQGELLTKVRGKETYPKELLLSLNKKLNNLF